MDKKIRLTPGERTRMPGSQLEKIRESTRAKYTSDLLNYYFQWAEFGQPNHIITNTEAQQVLGCKNEAQLSTLLHNVFALYSLTDLLMALKLPNLKEKLLDHKPKEEFTKKMIWDWYLQFAQNNGYPPMLTDVKKAIVDGQLPAEKIIEGFTKFTLSRFTLNFKAQWESTPALRLKKK